MGQNERQIKIVLDRGPYFRGEYEWGAGLLSPPAVVIDDLPKGADDNLEIEPE